MTLIGKTGVYGSLRRSLALSQELPGKQHSPLYQVGMGRYSDFASKTAQQLESAYTADSCKFS